MCAGAGCAWGRDAWSLYLPAPDLWFPALQASAHKGFLGVNKGQLGQLVSGRRQLLPEAYCEK